MGRILKSCLRTMHVRSEMLGVMLACIGIFLLSACADGAGVSVNGPLDKEPTEICPCQSGDSERIEPQSVAHIEISMQVDMPADEGSPLGTLFEICDGNGNLVGGAGFSLANNTTQTSNPRVLSVFFKSDEDALNMVSLGKPFRDYNPAHLLTVDNRLIAIPYQPHGLVPKEYDPVSDSWHDMDVPLLDPDNPIMAIQVINGKSFMLYYNDAKIYYDGTELRGHLPWVNRNALDMYYLNGRIYVFHEGLGGEGGYAVSVCEWVLGEDVVSDCNSHVLPGDDWILYTLFPSADFMDLLLMDRKGRVFKVSNEGFNVLREPSLPGESYQLYSSLHWSGENLLGHYPSGNLIILGTGMDSGYIVPSIGHEKCSDPLGREAQSLAIYGGKIFVGVWPFGEVWEGMPGREWRLIVRPFEGETCGLGPYLDLLSGSGMPLLSLGQRIWSIANWSGGLAFSTSLLHPKYSEALDLLSSEEREPYGSVYYFQRGVEMACEVVGSGLMQLDVKIDSDEVSVWQGPLDGAVASVKICSRQLSPEERISMQESGVSFGDGIWGKYSGNLLQHDVIQE